MKIRCLLSFPLTLVIITCLFAWNLFLAFKEEHQDSFILLGLCSVPISYDSRPFISSSLGCLAKDQFWDWTCWSSLHPCLLSSIMQSFITSLLTTLSSISHADFTDSWAPFNLRFHLLCMPFVWYRASWKSSSNASILCGCSFCCSTTGLSYGILFHIFFSYQLSKCSSREVLLVLVQVFSLDFACSYI